MGDALLFAAPPLLFFLFAFRFSPFALFFLFCCCAAFFCPPSFLSSPAGGFSCFSPVADVFPLLFIRRRGVVEMVLRLGGFFSSLRLALLNTQHNGTRLKTFTVLLTACLSCRNIQAKTKSKNSCCPTEVSALNAAVGGMCLFVDVVSCFTDNFSFYFFFVCLFLNFYDERGMAPARIAQAGAGFPITAKTQGMILFTWLSF